MTCAVCQGPLQVGMKFCPNCRHPVQQQIQRVFAEPTIYAPHTGFFPPSDAELVELARQYENARRHAVWTFWIGLLTCIWPVWIWTYIANTKMEAIRIRVGSKGLNVQAWADYVSGKWSKGIQRPLDVTPSKFANFLPDPHHRTATLIVGAVIAFAILAVVISRSVNAPPADDNFSPDLQGTTAQGAPSATQYAHGITTSQFLADAQPSVPIITLCANDGFPDRSYGDNTLYFRCSDGWVEVDTYLDTVSPIQEFTNRGVQTIRIKQAGICTPPIR